MVFAMAFRSRVFCDFQDKLLDTSCKDVEASGNKALPHGNLSAGDLWTWNWLNSNVHFIDVPADKNLGTVVMQSTRYDEMVTHQLNAAFMHIDDSTSLSITEKAGNDIRHQLRFAAEYRLLHDKQLDFCGCLLNEQARMPRVRGLVKIHKDVPTVRLIVANTRWITTPIAILVATLLQPIIDTFTSVATDTAGVVDALLGTEDTLTSACKLFTFDVENLYPSISQPRALAGIGDLLLEYHGELRTPNYGALIEFILALLSIIFNCQVAYYSFRGKKGKFRQVKGISTGLACGSQIANLWLRLLDRLALQSLGSDIKLLRRYLDDMLIIAVNTSVDTLLRILNSFDEDLLITFDVKSHGIEGKSSFVLALFMDIRSNYVYYRTYRKPLNTYNYVPFDSCHSRATKLGIIATEFVRLLRTNRHESDFEVAQLFSTGRFIERGYPHSELRRLSDKFCWSRKSVHAVKRQQSRVVPFKIQYNDVVQQIGISRILKEELALLPTVFTDSHRMLVCFTSGLNMFRCRYNRFL